MVKKLILERRLKNAREILDALEDQAAVFPRSLLPANIQHDLTKKQAEVSDLESKLAKLALEEAEKKRRRTEARRRSLARLKRLVPVVKLVVNTIQIVLALLAFALLIVAVWIGTREPSNLDLLNRANDLGDYAYYLALGITGSELFVFSLQRKWIWLAVFLIGGAVVFYLGYFVVGGLIIYLVEMCIPLVGGLVLALPLLNLRLTRRTIPQP
jgi:hypothetical protein